MMHALDATEERQRDVLRMGPGSIRSPKASNMHFVSPSQLTPAGVLMAMYITVMDGGRHGANSCSKVHLGAIQGSWSCTSGRNIRCLEFEIHPSGTLTKGWPEW